jgi:hypothetical protein
MVTGCTRAEHERCRPADTEKEVVDDGISKAILGCTGTNLGRKDDKWSQDPLSDQRNRTKKVCFQAQIGI